MSREKLREGWVRAWTRFYSLSSMARRYTVNKSSSWIQTLGFWPLNLMQNRLAHHKIAGGMQRFRSGLEAEVIAAAAGAAAAAPAPDPLPHFAPAAVRAAADHRRALPVVE
jgi:hypothetical protein